jgi:UDP-arabinose 4-epimerase
VSDLARAHILAVQYVLGDGDTIAVNLASGQAASVREVIDTARAATDRKFAARDGRDAPGIIDFGGRCHARVVSC